VSLPLGKSLRLSHHHPRRLPKSLPLTFSPSIPHRPAPKNSPAILPPDPAIALQKAGEKCGLVPINAAVVTGWHPPPFPCDTPPSHNHGATRPIPLSASASRFLELYSEYSVWVAGSRYAFPYNCGVESPVVRCPTQTALHSLPGHCCELLLIWSQG